MVMSSFLIEITPSFETSFNDSPADNSFVSIESLMYLIIALFVGKFKKNYKNSQEENAIISPIVTEEKPVIIEATVETVESKENITTEEPPKAEEDKTENKESEVI